MSHPYTGPGSRSSGALFLYASANQKLSPVMKVPYNGPAKDKFPYRPTPVEPFCCSTYVSISATCPDSCSFKRGPNGEAGGCYADAGKTVHTIARLDREAGELHGDEVIVAEADLIRSAFRAVKRIPQDGPDKRGRPLRLHVGGDFATTESGIFIAEAVRDWLKRGGGPVWTYTHRWAEIARLSLAPISVLASIEGSGPSHTVAYARSVVAKIAAVRAQGYAPALVVDKHRSPRSYFVGETRMIPCPAETQENVHCTDCKLCFDADALYRRNAGIAFALHGSHRPRALVNLGIRPKQWRLPI